MTVAAPAARWAVPEIVRTVEDDGEWWVEWGFDSGVQPPTDECGRWSRRVRYAELGPELLDRFLALKPRGVVAFARRWGVLGADSESHAPLVGRVPLAAWAQAQRYLDAVVRASRDLSVGTVPQLELLERVEPEAAAMLDVPGLTNLAAAQQMVFGSLNWQLRHVSIQLQWPALGTGEWGISLAPRSLWGALVAQTAHTVLGEDALTSCTGCGQMHVRSRRRSDGVSYCQPCRDAGVPARLRKRRQRSRERSSIARPSRGRSHS